MYTYGNYPPHLGQGLEYICPILQNIASVESEWVVSPRGGTRAVSDLPPDSRLRGDRRLRAVRDLRRDRRLREGRDLREGRRRAGRDAGTLARRLLARRLRAYVHPLAPCCLGAGGFRLRVVPARLLRGDAPMARDLRGAKTVPDSLARRAGALARPLREAYFWHGSCGWAGWHDSCGRRSAYRKTRAAPRRCADSTGAG